MLLSPHLKKKLNFFKENTFPKKIVDITCETCAVKTAKRGLKQHLNFRKEKYIQKLLIQ
jgi:hypothetical protein